MLSQSITSDYDQTRYDLIPRYLVRKDVLFGKYAEDKFGGNIDQINAAYGTRFIKLQDVSPPPSADLQTIARWNSSRPSCLQSTNWPALQATQPLTVQVACSTATIHGLPTAFTVT